MNKNPFLIPISIVIAAIVIAGAVIYRPGEKTAVTVKAMDYVELAGELGLDTAVFKTCVDNRTYKNEIAADSAVGEAAGVGGTPTTYINDLAIEGAASYATYKMAVEQAIKEAKPVASLKVGADDDAILGDPKAPVLAVVFGDYQCPFCEQAYRTSETQLRKEYVDTGKVQLVFRDFPLSFHQSAQPAAEAAECAGAQGKYWEYHDALFDNQERL